MHNLADHLERRKEVPTLEVVVGVRKSGRDAVPEKFTDQFATAVDTILIAIRDTTAVSY